MIELLNIIFFPILLILFLNNHYLFGLEKYLTDKKIELFDIYILNLFIILNIILILSIFDILLINIIYSVLIFFIISNFANLNIKIIKMNLKRFSKYIFFIIIFYILSVLIVSNPDLDWDGKFHWYKRALSFYQDMGYENLKNLPKYEYPHFGSLLWAIFWKTNSLGYEYFGRLFYLFIYLLSIHSIIELVQNQKIKIYLFIAFAIICFDINHFLGNQDILLFSLIIFIARYTYLILLKKKANLYYIFKFILINNIIFWVKYESFVYVLIFYFIILISVYLSRQNRSLIILLSGLTFSLILKAVFQYMYKINIDPSFQFSGNYSFIELFNFQNFITKNFFIFKYYIFSLFKNPIFIISYLILLIMFLNKKKLIIENLVIFLLFTLSTFFIFYIIQNDFQWHVINGISRYMFQYSGFSLIFIVDYLNKNFK
jgi:hypothetical protein